MRRHSRGVTVCLLTGVLALACGDDLGPPPEPEEVPPATPRLETSAPPVVSAGDPIPVTCTLNTFGMLEIVPAQLEVTPEDSIERAEGDLVAVTAGTVEVACVLPDRGLVDSTPAVIEIVPGAPQRVVTTVSPNPIIAGETLTATCEVFDARGNPVEEFDAGLTLSPGDPGNTIDGLTAEMTRAGSYVAACEVPGATGDAIVVEVLPALPAAILLGRVPDQLTYRVSETVEITHLVEDRYGNPIPDAMVSKVSVNLTGAGPTTQVGADLFRYGSEGHYRIDAAVDGPTDEDVPVEGSVEVLVNSLGPGILCNGPADATMVDVTPGSNVTFQGEAADVNGVAQVFVNGSPIALAGDGTFSAAVTTRFGLNFVNVTAVDDFGAESTRVCSFLAANRWSSPATVFADMVMLKLNQAAWDNGSTAGPVNDFNDILSAVLNSPGPREALHSALLAANPLKPSSCDQQICVIGCICVLRSEVIYLSSRFDGPNTSRLDLVTGGVRATARLENLGVRLRVRGHVSGIPYDTTGWVNIRSVDVALTLDTYLSGGRPRISVRPNTVSVSVGSITTSFSGIDGFVLNLIATLANGTVRNLVASTLRDYIRSNFNSVLDGVVSGLDISALGTTFDVPRISGGGTIPVSFAVGFSSLGTTTSRMLFGISTRFLAPVATNYQTLGAPIPPGAVAVDPPTVTSTAVAAHVGILNQLSHALWRAGMFDVTLAGDVIDPDEPGASVVVRTRLPPVAMVQGSSVVVHLGGLEVAVSHPSLPADLVVTLGATARTSVALSGDALQFGAIAVEELHVSSDLLQLDAAEQAELEDLLLPIVQTVIDQALGALPSFPLPSFTIPPSLTAFGVPTGELGIASPSLAVTPQHLILRGGFGIQ